MRQSNVGSDGPLVLPMPVSKAELLASQKPGGVQGMRFSSSDYVP